MLSLLRRQRLYINVLKHQNDSPDNHTKRLEISTKAIISSFPKKFTDKIFKFSVAILLKQDSSFLIRGECLRSIIHDQELFKIIDKVVNQEYHEHHFTSRILQIPNFTLLIEEFIKNIYLDKVAYHDLYDFTQSELNLVKDELYWFTKDYADKIIDYSAKIVLPETYKIIEEITN